MKVALVHDWLTGMRGGERVLERIAARYPGAPIHTLFWKRGAVSAALEAHPIHTSWLQRLPGADTRYRWFLPLYPDAIERFDLSAYDLVVSTSHAVAKSVRTRPETFHLSYVFTPMRYVWELEDQYFPPGRFPWPVSAYVRSTCARIRRWDAATATRPDRLLADSAHVAARIRRHWGRDATVVYPPVDVARRNPGAGPREYALLAGAFAPYKRPDLAIAACARVGWPLVVVGSGPDEARLRALAGPSVSFRGWVSDDELIELFQHARVLLFPGEEDFGIIPVEAMACGCPVIAYGRGGALETVGRGASEMALATVAAGGVARVEGGVLFGTPSVEGLVAALKAFERERFDPQTLHAHAAPFAAERFDREFDDALASGLAEHHGRRAVSGHAPTAVAASPTAIPGRSIRGNAIAVSVAQIAAKLAGLVTVLALTRVLAVEEFGRYTLAIAFVAVLSPLADLGMDMHVTRLVALAPTSAALELGASLTLKLALGVGFTAVAWLAAAACGYQPPVPALIALAALVSIGNVIGNSWFSVLRGLRRMDREAIGTVLARALQLGGTLLALALGARVAGVLGAQVVATALGVAGIALVCRGVAPAPRLRDARTRWPELARGGWPFALTAIVVTVYFRLDTVMLSLMRGERSTGLYGAGANLLFAALMVSSALVTAVFPVVAETGSIAGARVRSVMRRAGALSLAASLPMALGASFLGGPVLALLFGERYRVAAPALTLLMWTAPVLFATNLVGHALAAIGRQRQVLAIAAVNAALNVGLNLILIPRLDYTGAALATLITELVGLTAFAILLRGDMAAFVAPGAIVRVLAANAAFAGLLLALRNASWALPLTLALAVAGYLLAAWAVGVVRGSDLAGILPARLTGTSS